MKETCVLQLLNMSTVPGWSVETSWEVNLFCWNSCHWVKCSIQKITLRKELRKYISKKIRWGGKSVPWVGFITPVTNKRILGTLSALYKTHVFSPPRWSFGMKQRIESPPGMHLLFMERNTVSKSKGVCACLCHYLQRSLFLFSQVGQDFFNQQYAYSIQSINV